MEEMIEVQTVTEVQHIDDKRELANTLDTQIVEQNSHMEVINNQLSSISDSIENIQTDNVDLTEITDKIDDIDVSMVIVQNQDILETLNNQQNQINSIEEKLNNILNIIEEMK